MINPVACLRDALAKLAESDPTSGELGPLRKRAVLARDALPEGALDVAAAAELEAAWRKVFDRAVDPPAATRPSGAVGTTYWLSSHCGVGGVLRVAIEARGADAPWRDSEFWPNGAADRDAVNAARAAHELCKDVLGATLDPLFGYHRARVVDGGAHDVRIDGGSLGAALALMLVSLRAGHPIPFDVAVTGNVTPDGRLVLRADHDAIRTKVDAVARERRCIRTVYVPKRLEIAHESVRVVGLERFEDLLRETGVPLPATPAVFTLQEWLSAVGRADALATSRGADESVLRERFEQLERSLHQLHDVREARTAVLVSRVQVLRRLCEYRSHTMDLDGLRDVNAKLDELLAEHGDRIPWSGVAAVRNAQASARIDLREIAAARRAANEALDACLAARDVLEEPRILSTMGRIEAHAGRDREALVLFDRALARFEQALPWESNIARSYRSGVLARLGRYDEARRALEDANRASIEPTVAHGWRMSNDVFLAYEALKVSLREGDLVRAEREARWAEERARGRGSWPLVGVLRSAVDCALRAGDRGEATRALREVCEIADREAGAAWVIAGNAAALLVAQDLVDARTPDPTALERTRVWLDRLPAGDEDNPFLGPAREARALIASPGAELAAALRKLCEVEIY